jgi:hypothetical protein
MKKTLLMAAAALAAGVISSQAQPVYSQNIVGYANVVTPNGGTCLLSSPFKIGSSNGLNEVFSAPLPDASSVLLWNGAGYNTYVADSGSPSGWDDADFNPLTQIPTVAVGQGFFLIPAGNVTNTFLGSIAVSTGTSNQMVLPNGGTYLVASVVPYAGSITNGNSSGGGPNLNNLPDASSLLFWNGSGYDTYVADSGSPSGWDDADFNPLSAPPSVSVGQGFFIIPAGAYTWTTGL